MRTSSRVRASTTSGIAAIAVIGLIAGCGSGAVDKQGAPAAAVLHVGTADPSDRELAYFAEAVARISQDRLRVEVDPTTYFSETPGGEARLVDDLQAGKVDFGYIPSRDWAAAGDPGFQAVQAPFLISTTAAAAALAVSPLAGDLLSGLDSRGAVGLGLVPGEARRLIARSPITTVSDLAGTTVRINDNPHAAQLMAAWGATPRQGISAAVTGADLASGRLDAVETAPSYAASNHYQQSAPYLSSFGLFPKLQVLVAGKAAWHGLDEAEQLAVRQAAADTVSHAALDVPAQEASELSQLCANGMVIVQPELAVLKDLTVRANAAQPTDTPTRQVMEAISASVSGTGAKTLAGPVPSTCPIASTAEEARRLHEAAGHAATAGQVTNEAFPTGIFEVTVTAEQWAAAGITGADWDEDTTFTWTLTPDGKVTVTQQPDFPDQGPASGTWAVNGDRVTFTLHQGVPDALYVETAQWSYFQGVLHFVVVSVLDDAGRVIYATPWHKVG